MPQAYIVTSRIGTDSGDDLVDMAMIARARIVIPGAAVALQQRRASKGP